MTAWGRFCACIMALIAPNLVMAQDQPSRFYAAGAVEFQYDIQAGSGSISTLSNTSELALGMRIGNGFSIESTLIYEPVRGASSTQYLAAHGLYAETLMLQYTGDNFTVFAGKIDPVFGLAWDLAPGLYGTEFAKEYQLTERVGFGADINLGGAFGAGKHGEHILSASLYRSDTSFLSDSLFTRRGHVHHDDGGTANTQGLSSFAIALDGMEIPGLSGFAYHIAVRSQGSDVGNARREKGVVGGITYDHEMRAGYEMALIAEASHIWHADGQLHHEVTIGTLGAMVSKKDWSVSADYLSRTVNNKMGLPGSPDSHQIQLSVGHNLAHNLALEAGWKRISQSGSNANVFGMLFSFTFG
ncbi:MAG: hypothetical protein COA85_06325 [Robiginitomaculum sp.]|nr:MAG: hypothetical protein COA85_06325 [Robiginitomaculum sp.]